VPHQKSCNDDNFAQEEKKGKTSKRIVLINTETQDQLLHG
jgi:hypothetical protein